MADLFDMITLGENGIGDLSGGGGYSDLLYDGISPEVMGGKSASNYFTSLVQPGEPNAIGSGTYGTDTNSLNNLLGLPAGSNVTPVDLAKTAQENGGVTGIGPLDHVLSRITKGLGDRWEKDPLALIGTGLAVLSKIQQMRNSTPNPIPNFAASMSAPRTDAQYRTANPPASSFAPRQAPQPGALSQIVQIPIKKVS